MIADIRMTVVIQTAAIKKVSIAVIQICAETGCTVKEKYGIKNS